MSASPPTSPTTTIPATSHRALAVPAIALVLLAPAACGGPPDDRAEARARVEAAAESLRASHQQRWGVATEEERARLARDTTSGSE